MRTNPGEASWKFMKGRLYEIEDKVKEKTIFKEVFQFSCNKLGFVSYASDSNGAASDILLLSDVGFADSI
jgi:hypothetical protein